MWFPLNLFYLFNIILQGCSSFSSPISLMDQYQLEVRSKDQTPVNVSKMVMMKKENNEVFITVATYGYREFTLDFYQSSHLQDYNNFFVVVQDVLSYQVFFLSSFQLVLSIPSYSSGTLWSIWLWQTNRLSQSRIRGIQCSFFIQVHCCSIFDESECDCSLFWLWYPSFSQSIPLFAFNEYWF